MGDLRLQGGVEERVFPEDAGQLAKNAWADVGDTLNGLKTLSTIMMTRGFESIPGSKFIQAPDPGELLQQDPIGGFLPQPAIRPDDFGTAMQVGQGIVDHYMNDYITPISQGDFDTPLQYAGKHPVNFAMDIAPGVGIAGKGLGKAGAAFARTAPGAQLIQAAAPITQRVAPVMQAAKALPGQAVDAIYQGAQKVASNSGIINEANKWMKGIALGFNPAWAVGEPIQGAMVNGLAMWKSPRDLMTSVAAHLMALDRNKVRGLLPHQILEPPAATATPASLANSTAVIDRIGRIKVAGPLLKKIMETNFKLPAMGEAYNKSVLGMYELMRRLEAAHPEQRLALGKLLDINARWGMIENAVKNQHLVEEAAKELMQWHGNYGAEAAKRAGVFRELFPFWTWYEHAMSLHKALLTKSPVKAALGNHIAQAVRQYQDPEGLLSKEEKESGAILARNPDGSPKIGPNGKYMLIRSTGLTPLTQAPELLHFGSNLITGGHELPEGLVISPILGMASMIGAGRDALSGRPFDDPRLVHVGGERYTPQGKKADVVRPPAENILPRAMFPALENNLRTFHANAYGLVTQGKALKPSDQTSILPLDVVSRLMGYKGELPLGNAVPAATQQFPHGIDVGNPLQNQLMGLGKVKPTEQMYSKAEQEHFKRMTDVKVMKATNHQRWRIKY